MKCRYCDQTISNRQCAFCNELVLLLETPTGRAAAQRIISHLGPGLVNAACLEQVEQPPMFMVGEALSACLRRIPIGKTQQKQVIDQAINQVHKIKNCEPNDMPDAFATLAAISLTGYMIATEIDIF